MKEERIFITGGAGFLGANLVKRYQADNEVTVYSRDEAKHYYLKKMFPAVNCIIGDVRNYELLSEASKGHTIGIFAASLKQIEAVDQNVTEGIKIIVDGALNSRKAAIHNEFKAAVFISSDKSRAATTLYGAMKFVAGESFIVNSIKEKTRLSTIIYGNVTNSTGSIIPLIWNAINCGYPLTLYSEDMTRFMISIEKAMRVIDLGLTVSGFNVIPALKAFRVKDLFEIYAEKFGLVFTCGSPRVSEKIHEMMIAKEELPRTLYSRGLGTYFMHYKNIAPKERQLKKEYVSNSVVVSKKELFSLLEKNRFYSPGGKI